MSLAAGTGGRFHLLVKISTIQLAENGHMAVQCVKGKKVVTLVQALRLCTGCMARRGSRSIALPFHDHGTRRVLGVSVTPWLLFTPGKTWYPLYRKLGGPQGWSGQVRKISLPPGFNPQTVQPVASHSTDYATLFSV